MDHLNNQPDEDMEEHIELIANPQSSKTDKPLATFTQF